MVVICCCHECDAKLVKESDGDSIGKDIFGTWFLYVSDLRHKRVKTVLEDFQKNFL